MVNEMVAIVAQPSKIFNLIIEMVMVDMVDCQNSYVDCLAQLAYLCDTSPQ